MRYPKRRPTRRTPRWSAPLLLVLAAVSPSCAPDDGLDEEIAQIAAAGESRDERIRTLERGLERSSRRLDGLQHAIDALESRPPPSAHSAPTVNDPVASSSMEDAPVHADPSREDASADLSMLRELLPRALSGELVGEDQQRFWSLLRQEGAADELVAASEAAVERSPGDIEARMALANAYVAKLFTVPPGPEMGVWGGKAEGQWTAVLEADPGHWRARYALAESWSHYPEQLNKTPDAIREFETLADQQETRAVESRHARVYVQLSVLYRRQGREADARAVLERGLRRHPDDPGLRKTLESLGEEDTR